MKATQFWRKALVVLGAVASSALLLGTAVNASPYSPNIPFDPNTYGISFVDSYMTSGGGASHIVALSTEQISGMPNEYLCNDSRSGVCDFKVNHASAYTIMPICSASVATDCVENFAMATGEGGYVPATFLKSLGGTTFAASPSENLPTGGTPSLWKSQVTNGGGSNTYEVFVQVHSDFRGGKFIPNDMSATVVPYTQVSGAYQPVSDQSLKLPNGRMAVSSGGYVGGCAWTDSGTCGNQEDFAPESKVKVTIRLDGQLGGWFKGRISEAGITVTPGGTYNEIAVSGKPVSVANIAVVTPKADAPAAVAEYFAQWPGYIGGVSTTRVDYPNAFQALNAFRLAAGDKVQGQTSTWSFGSFGASGNPCLTDTSKVQGLVTTNATVYDGKAPQFNNGVLSYSVGSYHYLPDGKTLNLGTYDLIMRKDTARCLYGFSKAPIAASVSVTSDSGTENVANTNFTEDANWDRFTAHGFTFSNPTISVALSQDAVASSGTSAKSITCTKGKLTKKVTGAAAKCPAGWKEK